jgi:hypothetical protein
MRSIFRIDDTDITANCSYPFTTQTYSAQKEYGLVSGSYLRTGYIYDSENIPYLTMSARRANAGTAFVTFSFPEEVSVIYYDVALWGGNELFDFQNDTFVLEYCDSQNQWNVIENIPLYLLTMHRDSPKWRMKVFNLGYDVVRFRLESSAIGDRNKGRVVLSKIMFVGDTYLP